MKNKELTINQQHIVSIAAFTANGDLEKLSVALHNGLNKGLTINEIKEVITQMYAYAGFPRSLNGIAKLMQVLNAREQQGIVDELGKEATPLPTNKTSLALGTDIQTYLVGMPVSGAVMDFVPVIDYFLKAHLFGDIFGRDVLDYQTREIATISALSTMGGVDSQLQSHIKMAINIGVTIEQIESIIDTLSDGVGKKEADILRSALTHSLSKS